MKGINKIFNKSSWTKFWGDKSEKRGCHFVGTSQSIQRSGISRFRYIWGSLTHKVQWGGGPSCWLIIINCRSFLIEGIQSTLKFQMSKSINIWFHNGKRHQCFHCPMTPHLKISFGCLFRVRSRALGFYFSIFDNYVRLLFSSS